MPAAVASARAVARGLGSEAEVLGVAEPVAAAESARAVAVVAARGPASEAEMLSR